MRTRLFTALFVLVSATFWQCSRPVSKTKGPRDTVTPLRAPIEDRIKGPNPGFNKNQLVFFPNHPLSPQEINELKNAMGKLGITGITIQTCNSCSGDVQLWNAPNIYTYVMSEGVRSGSGGGGSNGVGEDRFGRYSFNWDIRIDTTGVSAPSGNYNKNTFPVLNLAGKRVVRIAVLDTGADTVRYIHNSYLWNNSEEKRNNRDDDKNCYTDDVAGWNFLNNTPDFSDDNLVLHGSLVTKYIIDQFVGSRTNAVQIMALKTHDDDGYGNLFASICALNYAIDNNANIINASWGFYSYGSDYAVPYLDSLITQVMPRKGIIFVTAAGNKVDADDAYASSVYRAMHGGATITPDGLRNLQIHNFYPAILSTASNNVIVATTTNTTEISPTQNYSSLYVDLGVRADQVTPLAMKFRAPFVVSGPAQFISGSSFAAAIAAGKIGVNFKTTLYRPGITKNLVFSDIDNVIRRSAILKNNQLVRDGRYIER